MTNLYPQLTAAATETARVAGAVTPEQLTSPTPATEWDVRALANHLVLWSGYNFELRARGETVSAELQQRDFTTDPAWAADYATRLDRALTAWADPAAWEGELKVGDSSMPAATIAALNLLELVLHGWELAAATGQSYHADDSLADTVLGLVEEYAGMYRSYPGGFAEALPTAADAPALDRALALSGRDPRWSG